MPIDIYIVIGLIVMGYLVGTLLERRHYKAILLREAETLSLSVSAMKEIPFDEDQIASAELVQGNVVVATDYFKRLAAGLRGLFGGNIRVYESLIDRARREAILRLKESARGADMIVCLRIETSAIGVGPKAACVEAFAYGTAVTLKK